MSARHGWGLQATSEGLLRVGSPAMWFCRPEAPAPVPGGRGANASTRSALCRRARSRGLGRGRTGGSWTVGLQTHAARVTHADATAPACGVVGAASGPPVGRPPEPRSVRDSGHALAASTQNRFLQCPRSSGSEATPRSRTSVISRRDQRQPTPMPASPPSRTQTSEAETPRRQALGHGRRVRVPPWVFLRLQQQREGQRGRRGRGGLPPDHPVGLQASFLV